MNAISEARDSARRYDTAREPIPTAAAHGPTGALEAPDWPPLCLDEAVAVLRPYAEAGEAIRLLTVSPRPFSAASLVETSRGSVFIKKHPRVIRTATGLREEHLLQEYLSEARWPDVQPLVQAPLRDRAGATVQELGDWVYEVHPAARGSDLYRDAHSWTPFFTVDHARAAGRALATLHRVVEGYRAEPRELQPLVTSWMIFAADDPLRVMETYLKARPALEAYTEDRNWRESMRELLLPWHARLRSFLPHLNPVWTHNDFHASNLMWAQLSASGSQAHVSAIVDFGLSDRTNAVHDIATAIERNAIEWLRLPGRGIVHLDQVDALLAGYEQVRPLSIVERQAVPAILPLVHCEFALSETDYYLSVLHDSAKAYLGYEGYFLGHAHWFRTAEGARLLEHLERWAGGASHGTEHA